MYGEYGLLMELLDFVAAFGALRAGFLPQTFVNIGEFGNLMLVLDEDLLELIFALVTFHKFLEQLELLALGLGQLTLLLLRFPLAN